MKTPRYSVIHQGSKLLLVSFTAGVGLTSLAQAQSVVGYNTWIATKGLTGSDAYSTADPDHDGVPNSLECVFGGEPNPANADFNSAALLATPTMVGGDLICTFKRKDASEDVINVDFQWSTDLEFNSVKSVSIKATSATTDGVSVTVTENTPDAATDTITIRVPALNASGNKLFGRLQAIPSAPFKRGKASGYFGIGATDIPQPYANGFSIYTAAWPLLDHFPGNEFESGLIGTWMFPKVPAGVNVPFYSDVEGGLGWWRGGRFPSLTPKFRTGGVSADFNGYSSGPGHGSDSGGGKTATAQISPWLLFPIDGLTLKEGTNGELFGYGYQLLPFTDAKNMTANPSLQTGENCWTLFLNTSNFKGPVCFVTPYFWSRASLAKPEYNPVTLEKFGADPSKPYQMETHWLPSATATTANGEQYGRTRIYFPANSGNDTILMHRVTNYNKDALWNGVKSWFDGTGPAVTGSFKAAGSFPMDFNSSYSCSLSLDTQVGTPGSGQSPLAWEKIGATYLSSDKLSYGVTWNSPQTTFSGPSVMLPEYYHRITKNGEYKWYPVPASEVPVELKTPTFVAPAAPSNATRLTPAEWIIPSATNPGPVAGPFTVRLNDKSLLTYYWFRFADQPALLDADLTVAEREAMQLKVVKLHQNWKKDMQYMAPPTVGTLATLDSAQIVTPPAGLEVGYVPIATRQELAPPAP